MKFNVQAHRSAKEGRLLLLYLTDAPNDWVVRRIEKRLADATPAFFRNAAHLVNLDTEKVVSSKGVSFRVLCCFKLARARGDFKEIGIV